MNIDTPLGQAEIPDCLMEKYKYKTDVELMEILLEQYKRFLDPVLIKILCNKGLVDECDNFQSITKRLQEMKQYEFEKYNRFCKKHKLNADKPKSLTIYNTFKMRCNNG